MKYSMHKIDIKEQLTCRKVEEFLMAYLDKELGFWSRVRFRLHLLICSDCKNYIQEYKNTIKLGKQLFELPDVPAAGNVPDQILEAIINCK